MGAYVVYGILVHRRAPDVPPVFGLVTAVFADVHCHQITQSKCKIQQRRDTQASFLYFESGPLTIYYFRGVHIGVIKNTSFPSLSVTCHHQRPLLALL